MGRKRKLCSEFDEPDGEDKPVQRNAANERERARMRVLSKAFTRLKTTLPWVPPDTKLSKLDTLRLATCYIGHLRQVLAEDEGENVADTNGSSFVHPMNLTWPFTFSGKPVGDCPGGGEQESHHDQKILMPKQEGISTLS